MRKELTPLVTPVVHINGNRGQQMADELCEVASSAERTRDCLRDALPNMRNYYPLPDGAARFEADMQTFGGIMNTLQDVADRARLAAGLILDQAGG